MPKSPTRLELTWIGKHNRPKLEPRILLERPEHGHGKAAHSANSPKGSAAATEQANMLIHGDNLLALKALEADYTGKIKCICIDPPYNTGSAFEHYDDGLEHSVWLSLMRDRLEIMRKLLSEDGSIWVFADDSESHYLKVMMDEIFGRRNFICDLVWQKRTSPESRLTLGSAHDYILCFGKNSSSVDLNRLPATSDSVKGYSNPDNDPRGDWASTDFTAQGWRPNQMYTIETPSGTIYESPENRCWGATEPVFKKHLKDNRIWFGRNSDSRPRLKKFLCEHEGLSSWSWLANDIVGHNQEAKKESNALFGSDDSFATPKPERLIHRILTIATNPGDLVLDSFAGSGTTGAVAHKMGRRWIMCELGEHAFTHIVPRMRKVIDGEDPGGVTETTNWKGGGGFRTYQLAPTLMTKDDHGQFVINPDYNAEMLAEAVCRHEGYTYDPSQDVYWIHGRATEQAFIYVTTQTFTEEQLRALDDTVGDDRGLLVVCSAWKGSGTTYDNLTLKKIPRAVLDRCDWGRDDYSLNVESVQGDPEEDDDLHEEGEEPKTAQARMF